MLTCFCLNCKMQWKGEGFNCKKGSLHREGEFHGYSAVVVVVGLAGACHASLVSRKIVPGSHDSRMTRRSWAWWHQEDGILTSVILLQLRERKSQITSIVQTLNAPLVRTMGLPLYPSFDNYGMVISPYFPFN